MANMRFAVTEVPMPTLLEEHRRSNLTFVADQGQPELIRFDQLRRVREPVSRSKSGVQGKVADVLHGRSRHAESQNELRAFQILMATGTCRLVAGTAIHSFSNTGMKKRNADTRRTFW